MCGRRLGAVDVGEGDEEPVPDAEDQTTEVDDAPAGGADLDGGSQSCEEAGEPQSRLAAEEVGEGARKN